MCEPGFIVVNYVNDLPLFFKIKRLEELEKLDRSTSA